MGWNRTGSLINRYKITEELLSGAFRIPCEFNFQILNYESRYQYFVSGNSRCDGFYLFANLDAVDFYDKCGFSREMEYRYSV